MDKKDNVVIIGGGACGPKAAARLRRLDANVRITMVQDESFVSYAACGLPYYISGAVRTRDSLLVRDAAAFKRISNVEVMTATRVDSIDRLSHRLQITSLNDSAVSFLDYDKLVIATGATPVVPPIEGIQLKGIHILRTIPDAEDIMSLMSASLTRKAVIVGGGLIGMEMADALVTNGFQVTIVEALDRVLPAILDREISDLVQRHLKSKGVALELGSRVVTFEGTAGKVARCITDKRSIEADLVIVSIGVRPNSKLAKQAGLELGPFGDIVVNDHMQTSDPDIYAGGDCVANTHLATSKKIMAPNGSTSNKHGHVIGTNIGGGKERFPGIVASACARVFDFNVGRVGLGERQGLDAGYEVTTALIPGHDKPEYYPGAREIVLKLIVDTKTRRILGGQGAGPGEVVKRLDVLATAITMGMTVDTLADLDLCYAPPFNGALDVLHHLANLVRNKIEGRIEGIKPAQVKDKIDNKEDFVLLDVRSRGEWNSTRIEAPQALLLPQPELRDKVGEVPPNKEIVVMCRRGVRAYQAACTLKGAGFDDVKLMEGSLTCWCDDVVGKQLL